MCVTYRKITKVCWSDSFFGLISEVWVLDFHCRWLMLLILQCKTVHPGFSNIFFDISTCVVDKHNVKIKISIFHIVDLHWITMSTFDNVDFPYCWNMCIERTMAFYLRMSNVNINIDPDRLFWLGWRRCVQLEII